MTRVMLCGSRGPEDVRLLVEEGAHGIGLITQVQQNISCRLSLEEAIRLNNLIPPLVSSILSITEEDTDKICQMVELIKPDVVQLHGFNTAEQVSLLKNKLKIPIIKTLHWEQGPLLEEGDAEQQAVNYIRAGADAILLDSISSGKLGSTGVQVPLELARLVRDAIRPAQFILAGGLNAHNVAQAVEAVKPFAIDAFSSVITDGHLDRLKVREFIRSTC